MSYRRRDRDFRFEFMLNSCKGQPLYGSRLRPLRDWLAENTRGRYRSVKPSSMWHYARVYLDDQVDATMFKMFWAEDIIRNRDRGRSYYG